ncbi:FAD-dependent monooxygenase [Nonomuraea sp. NPDC048882]|uniref:FAD-dependent monooxygenase n=1 Tax=Nonomuraea sp. NPDC048882 TaxID=3154347 RepID=UPI0033F4765B
MDDTEVLVVGAGPAGLALACALRLHGIAVQVVDSASGPASTSRANILHARGVEVLDRLGALGDLPERALSAITITQHLDGRPAITIRFGDVGLGDARPALYISQADIEAELRRRLAELGVDVRWDTPLADLVQDADGVTALLGDERVPLRCRWLAGCDGSHSTVRKLAGIGFPGVRLTEGFLLADVHADWPVDRAGGHGWPHRDGPFFALPMREEGGADDLWRLMAYDPAGADGVQGDEEIVERFRRLVPERTGRADIRIKDAVWTSAFRIHRRLADTYRRGRIFLAGDAAHIHSPLGGQGMVTGMGDAENLRNRVLVPVANLPAVQRRAGQLASQLWATYRRGPLGGGGVARRRPRPGDRVADLICLRPTAAPPACTPNWAAAGRCSLRAGTRSRA